MDNFEGRGGVGFRGNFYKLSTTRVEGVEEGRRCCLTAFSVAFVL